MKSGLFDEEAVKQEAKSHNEKLNSIVGILSFTLGLTCLSFEQPNLAAVICLPIVFSILYQVTKYFPPTITALRDLAKETKDPHVIQVKNIWRKNIMAINLCLLKM